MIHVLLFFLILFLPSYSDAAYNVYLKNGSVITGVSTYEKRGGQYTIYFGGGSMGISETEVLKIEETAAPEKDFLQKETSETEAEKAPVVPSEEPTSSEKSSRASSLKAELDAIDAELKAVEENEARVAASINEKKGSRSRYNIYQQRLLDQELEPLQAELSTIQQKKSELLQKRAFIEGELRTLQ